MLLNFGHTLGPPGEQHFNYRGKSRKAVAIGMFQDYQELCSGTMPDCSRYCQRIPGCIAELRAAL